MMKNVLTVLVVIISLHAVPGAAEDPAFVMTFGGEPGERLAHGYDYGAPDAADPVYMMRIPSVDPTVRGVFSDVEVWIARDTRIVQRVHAERAYRIGGSCPEAREQIAEKLAALLPVEYRGDDTRWQYQSASGRMVGRVVCTRTRHLPMPVLVFDLALAGEP